MAQSSTTFKPGNKVAKNAVHSRQAGNMITQRLIAALNEEYVPLAKAVKDAKGKKSGPEVRALQAKITKMAAIVDKLIELALGGDLSAIKEVFDRVEGRAIQGVSLSGGLNINHGDVPDKLPPDLNDVPRDQLVAAYRDRVGIPVDRTPAPTAQGTDTRQ